ncbi:unnamed protein product [Phytomonas sp. Hart1]|nr:unnamed protein product [Phytomonas sp. Hart1]|eukprot:CCW71608.1 unnamed protein product [Phytomonas sp. isolate Hart1]
MTKYRCQSAFKLVELDRKFKIFCKDGCRTVIDLAAAPGGFTQVALEGMNRNYIGNRTNIGIKNNISRLYRLKPLVIAVDSRPIEPIANEIRILRCNVLHHRKLIKQLNPLLKFNNDEICTISNSNANNPNSIMHRAVDVVLHDGVSVVAGQHAFSVTYAQNQMVLSALLLACKAFSLALPSFTNSKLSHSAFSSSSGGVFVSKLMRSIHLEKVLATTRRFFRQVHLHKPSASRKESLETYLIAEDFMSDKWDAYLHDFTLFKGSGQRRRCISNPFSLPPDTKDVRRGMAVVWVCLGCGQMRTSCAPCPTCTGMW